MVTRLQSVMIDCLYVDPLVTVERISAFIGRSFIHVNKGPDTTKAYNKEEEELMMF